MVNNGPYTQHTLDNGLRILIESMPHVQSAAAGFLVLTGARDEVRELAGVSHFLEHMMFKGTPKRTWHDITADFDRMGSIYNASTGEDRTMYHGWVPRSDIYAQIELLADLLQSTLPPDEFNMEKKVILEEIATAKDSLENIAFDFLQHRVFEGHSLAWPILGYEETVGAMTRDQMWEYFQRRYTPDNMMMVVAGHVEPERIIEHVEKLCGHWRRGHDETRRTPPDMRTGVDVLVVERFNQQILAMTFPSVPATDLRCETVSAAVTILGGYNSRFFWHIEQEGISPHTGALHLAYPDCGAVLLYGSCQPEGADRLLDAIRREADRICKEKVNPDEVQRVKNKRRTALALEAEAPYHRLMQLMDDLEYRGAPRTVDEMLAEVEAVTPEGIHDYWQAYPINTEGHLASVGPRNWPAKD